MDKSVLSFLTALVSVLATGGGVLAAVKVAVELQLLSRTKYQDRYRFSKDFLSEYYSGTPMHPRLRQLGFFAIAGTDKVSVQDMEYLLRLKDSEKATQRFVAGLRYLQLVKLNGNKRIDFKPWVNRAWLRKALTFVGVSLYFVLWIFAWLPLLSLALMDKPFLPWEMALICIILSLPCAFVVLFATNNLGIAEKLVQTQERDLEVADFDRRMRVTQNARVPRGAKTRV